MGHATAAGVDRLMDRLLLVLAGDGGSRRCWQDALGAAISEGVNHVVEGALDDDRGAQAWAVPMGIYTAAAHSSHAS